MGLSAESRRAADLPSCGRCSPRRWCGSTIRRCSPIAFNAANAPGRLALSDAKMKSLGAFARHGDPNVPSALGVQWPTRPSRPAFDATPAQKVITVE